MRIALVGNWPRPFGGVSIHVAALARALRARGEDVSVVDIGEGDHDDRAVQRVRGALGYGAALARAAVEGRLVHVHTSGANVKSWLVALGAGRARRPGQPRAVLTLHSGSAPAFLRASGGHRRLAAAACAGFGRVVAVNGEIAAELVASGVPAGRVEVLAPFFPAVLEARRVPPGLTAFRAAHAPVFAAALSPGPIYGADLLLPAFAALRRRFPRAGLVAFGVGTEQELRGEGLLGLGEIDHDQALAVLEVADVFVRPTRADGDAVSVREALSLGCRVVASDVGHRPAACLIFPAGDGAALAERMAEACEARPPEAPAREADSLDDLVAAYRALWGEKSKITNFTAGRRGRG